MFFENVNVCLDVFILMVKFWFNIILDGEIVWDEDFWVEFLFSGGLKLVFIKLCN